MADFCIYAGLGMAVVGLYLLTGLAWTLLIAGLLLFVVGGLNSRHKDSGRQSVRS
jgi:hypothetical protein